MISWQQHSNVQEGNDTLKWKDKHIFHPDRQLAYICIFTGISSVDCYCWMLRCCTGVSEGPNSLQCYCPCLRHPEVINGLRVFPLGCLNVKKLWLESGMALECFMLAPHSQQKRLPLARTKDGGAGSGVDLRLPTHGHPWWQGQDWDHGHQCWSPSNHEVAARRMPAPIPPGSWTAGARVFMAAEPGWSQHSCGEWHRAWGALHVKEQP